MQWGGGANTASTEKKSCGYFHQTAHTDTSPSSLNERHTLGEENKHVHELGVGFED